ncbi:hypothetical protein PMAYCL1PPCAC_07558 [Pristionchus mayeri]|uniref:Uncharacterized protein n=1 Tax=Pristionchus mayeri TaxID=1317129 RepID=A0AAN4ZF46_9BILA|nr:hypothetical protein PMAYCL1PPCAC_07558 [Pristionchus mayeri]
MIHALMQFAQYDNHNKFKVLEYITPPNTTPSSPILSASPSLFFDRLRRKSQVEDCDEYDFSPCSSSTPEKSSSSSSSSSSDRSIDNHWRRKINKEISSNAHPAKRTLNWKSCKGLAVVNENVSRLSQRRFRFEEHCVDYARIEKKREEISRLERKKQEGLKEDSRLVRKLGKRLDEIQKEIHTVEYKLDALDSMRRRTGDSRIRSIIIEDRRRRSALKAFERVVQRRIGDAKYRMGVYY